MSERVPFRGTAFSILALVSTDDAAYDVAYTLPKG